LIEKGVLYLTGEELKSTLHRAAVAAGITCSRKGAQPPYKHELKGV
jgi:fructokinase